MFEGEILDRSAEREYDKYKKKNADPAKKSAKDINTIKNILMAFLILGIVGAIILVAGM
jgi:diacylglycerol kinase